jgi:hypothetical protein
MKQAMVALVILRSKHIWLQGMRESAIKLQFVRVSLKHVRRLILLQESCPTWSHKRVIHWLRIPLFVRVVRWKYRTFFEMKSIFFEASQDIYVWSLIRLFQLLGQLTLR